MKWRSQRGLIVGLIGCFLVVQGGSMFLIARTPGRQVPAPLWFDQWVMPGIPFIMGIVVLVVGILLHIRR